VNFRYNPKGKAGLDAENRIESHHLTSTAKFHRKEGAGRRRCSLPAYMAQGHSAEDWSHLRSNPLELSFSLRSKRLTEAYYASLILVFKLVGMTHDMY
jgi:hypothetical protein